MAWPGGLGQLPEVKGKVPQLPALWGPHSPRTWGGGFRSTPGKSGSSCVFATCSHHHFLPSLLLFIPNPPATPWLSRGPVPIPNLIVTHVHTQACAPMREGAGLRCPCCPPACPLGLRISAEWGVGGAGSHSAGWPKTLRVCRAPGKSEGVRGAGSAGQWVLLGVEAGPCPAPHQPALGASQGAPGHSAQAPNPGALPPPDVPL